MYPGRTRLHSVSVRRPQHQVSARLGSGSFYICGWRDEEIRPIHSFAQFENQAAKTFLLCFVLKKKEREKKQPAANVCVPAEPNTRTARLPASGRRKQELPPDSLGETPTCDMKFQRRRRTRSHSGSQHWRSSTMTGWSSERRESGFPCFLPQHSGNFFHQCSCKR